MVTVIKSVHDSPDEGNETRVERSAAIERLHLLTKHFFKSKASGNKLKPTCLFI